MLDDFDSLIRESIDGAERVTAIVKNLKDFSNVDKGEEQLANIWSEVLKIDRVGIHDNFFDLGGHSLMATQVVSRVRERMNVEIPLSEMFGYPTIAELAPIIEALVTGTGTDDKQCQNQTQENDHATCGW